jgi:predicted RNase H-like HicB family nuclease
MTKYRFTVVVERDEDGVYIASCPAMQGCHTQGDTYEEAVDNLKDAIRLHIEARQQLGEALPLEVAVDQVEVSV